MKLSIESSLHMQYSLARNIGSYRFSKRMVFPGYGRSCLDFVSMNTLFPGKTDRNRNEEQEENAVARDERQVQGFRLDLPLLFSSFFSPLCCSELESSSLISWSMHACVVRRT